MGVTTYRVAVALLIAGVASITIGLALVAVPLAFIGGGAIATFIAIDHFRETRP